MSDASPRRPFNRRFPQSQSRSPGGRPSYGSAAESSFRPPKSAAAPPEGSENWPTPWVQLKYVTFHPCIYPAMVGPASPDAQPGQIVSVYDRDGQRLGRAFYNPRARVPLRVFYHGQDLVGEDRLEELIDRAIEFRTGQLALPNTTDAFRVIHSDGDGLGGLVVDKFSDTLSVEVHSLGIFQRLPGWLPRLHEKLGTKYARVSVDPAIARIEGIRNPEALSTAPKTVRIRENGIKFEVNFEAGHKTGFFCDQRDNRFRLASWTRDRRVLDLCCYTGGFSLSAKLLGGASEVTGVDLDEAAIAQARRNANLNQTRIEWIHVDAFSYIRQMQRNEHKWDVVVLDPPKLILSRDSQEEDERRYEDLNGLALSLLQPGGLFVTCSCSGLLTAEAFEAIVIRSAHRQGRRLQFLDRTGAGADHPMLSNCPESRYLKVLWARLF